MNEAWRRIQNWCCILLLMLSVIISLLTTHYATSHFLDGDASSELVLAEHLAREKKILSEDWYYSTELRVVNTQLVHAPLFTLFDDWHMVRFVGAVIMQVMLVGAFMLVVGQVGCSFATKCMGAALVILPISVSYGRIVLYHTYYAPHIIISFVIVGLYLCTLRAQSVRRWAYAAVMTAISFLSGLGGVRQVVITQAPLLLICLYTVCKHAAQEPFVDAVKAHAAELGFALLAGCAFVPGFLINEWVLGNTYFFWHYSGTQLNLNNLNKLPEIVYGFLHQFGFRKNVKIISIVGIASLCGLYAGGYMLWQGVRSAKKSDCCEPVGQRVLKGFFVASMFTTVSVSLLTGSADAYPRYMLPAAVWAIPLLCVSWDRVVDHPRKAGLECVCTLLTIIALLGNSLVNAGYFSGHTIGFRQVYEGLYENEKLVEQLKGPLEAIRAGGYTVGYGTRWESGTMMELVDGEITVIPVVFTEDHAQLGYEEWLSLRTYQQLEPEHTFILFPTYLDKYYVKLPIEGMGSIIYQDELYTVYGLENAQALVAYLNREK